jgi:tetratricopeptide (TPR) repeat protein
MVSEARVRQRHAEGGHGAGADPAPDGKVDEFQIGCANVEANVFLDDEFAAAAFHEELEDTGAYDAQIIEETITGSGPGNTDKVWARERNPRSNRSSEKKFAHCAKCGKVLKIIRHCGRCSRAYYCGPQCQKADWKAHKPRCEKYCAEDDADLVRQTAARDGCGAGTTNGDSSAQLSDSDSDAECAICLEVLNPDTAKRLNCSHTFHRTCVKEWRKENLKSASQCPLCRAPLPPGIKEVNDNARDFLRIAAEMSYQRLVVQCQSDGVGGNTRDSCSNANTESVLRQPLGILEENLKDEPDYAELHETHYLMGITHRELARSLARTKGEGEDLALAIASIEHAIAVNPDQVVYYLALGSARMRNKDGMQETDPKILRAAKRDAQSPWSKLPGCTFRVFVPRKDEYQLAIAAITRALIIDPACAQGHSMLGDAYEQLASESTRRPGYDGYEAWCVAGSWELSDKAIASYEQAFVFDASYDAKIVWKLVERSTFFVTLKHDIARAVELFEGPIHFQRDSFRELDGYYCSGCTHVAREEHNAAHKPAPHFAFASSDWPSDEYEYDCEAELTYQIGNVPGVEFEERIIIHFAREVHLNPGQAWTNCQVGMALQCMDDMEKIIKVFKLRNPVESSYVHPKYGLCDVPSETADAIATFERRSAVDPLNVFDHIKLGYELADIEIKKVITALRRALAVHPDCELLHSQLHLLLAKAECPTTGGC